MKHANWKKVLKIILSMPALGEDDHEKDLTSIYDRDYRHQISILRAMSLISDETKDDGCWIIYLTDKGFTYFDIAWDKTMLFIRRSIIVPMVVSMVTTLLTWFIRWYLLST